jgi:hypothetical protein
MAAVTDSVPACAGAEHLRAMLMLEAQRLVPKEIVRHAA